MKYAGIESNLYRSMYPEKAGWTLGNQLLATIADGIRWLQWAKTKDGGKNRNRPEPIPRPGVGSVRKAVHPGAKGLPRTLAHIAMGRKESGSDRLTKLRQLFSKGSYDN